MCSLLVEKVKTNLEYYCLWSDAETHELDGKIAIKALPPAGTAKQWVLPVVLKEKITMKELDKVFDSIKQHEGDRPKEMILGIYDEDGTIMYYTVHDGIAKPKQS